MGVVLKNLTDGSFDLELDANGKMRRGDTYMQEVHLLLKLNQGELKADPLLGPSLIRMIRSKASQQSMIAAVKLHLARDRKRYDDVKNLIKMNPVLK